jgi:predicted ATPase
MDELLGTLLGSEPALDRLKQQVVERTEGNPFFLEECVRTLVETGVVVGQPSAYRLGSAAAEVALPPTVQAVIAARIDRLASPEKLLLQSAAVIGKDFRVALLQSIAATTDSSLEAVLKALRDAEFVHEARTDPEREYSFTHVLTHEVAYASVLDDRRRALHAAIVDVMERDGGERLAESVDRLAHHAVRGAVWPKAVAYLRQAGAQAAARSAYREAVTCFEQALLALAHLPQDRDAIAQAVDVHLQMIGPLAVLGQTDKLHERGRSGFTRRGLLETQHTGRSGGEALGR